jgi:class 3 adenylate cyclase
MAGREALTKHAWHDAFELLQQADADGELTAADLEGLAEAAWWTGRLDDCIAARERAFSAYMQENEPRRAALIALRLSQDHFGKLAHSIGAAWFNRAERLLENEPDSPAHGYLSWMHGQSFYTMGDHDSALECARRTLDIGTRYGDLDLQAFGLLGQGQALIAKSEVKQGVALLDEATVAAVSGELGPLASGIIYCVAIHATASLGDYERAGQWTEASKRWCERQSIAGFPGICRVHRAEIMRLRGAWAEAEQEARRALTELQNFNLEFAAAGFYELGEVRLRMGDFEAAGDAFRQAHELGKEPQPGLALLRLAEGRIEAASSQIGRALDDSSLDRLSRSRLLPAQVEIGIAAGDIEAARPAVEELEGIATDYESQVLEASSLWARGALQLAEEDSRDAVRTLIRSWKMWQAADLPYEAARARTDLGLALRASGDEEGAAMEIRAARSMFEKLGAVPELRRVSELLGDSGEGPIVGAGTSARVTKTFMFTDMVSSTNLVEALGDEAWEALLAWHDQTLRKLFMAHCGEEVNQVGDGFFVAFDDPTDAVECAAEVQKRLDQHRKQNGFAPQVRIGLHATEATRKGRDYGGKGVHTAARVGQLAQGGEILATKGVIDAARLRFPVSNLRSVELKGVSAPVQVALIDAS